MHLPSKSDMLEATRLTREGRLADAMAILQGTGSKTAQRPEQGPAQGPAQGIASKAGPVIDGLLERLGRPAQKPDAARPKAGTAGTTPAGRFETRSFAGEHGRLDYKLYVPASLSSASPPVPLVVMLHGCTQDPDDFAAGTGMNDLAERDGFLVAYPRQSRSANASLCWNWFNPSDQRRDGGEAALIAGITRQIAADHPVDRRRIYAAGLSAGGAAAAILGARHPDLYAAIGVHSGLACGAARDMPSAFAAMKNGAHPSLDGQTGERPMPTIVFHGGHDTTVHPVNGEAVIAQSRGRASLSATTMRGRSEGGIAYEKTVHAHDRGRPVLEHWVLEGVGHAWSGGSGAGSYTAPAGPDASAEMLRFFRLHALEDRDGLPPE